MQLDKFLTAGEIVLTTNKQNEPTTATLLAHDEHGITVQLDGLRGVTYLPWTSVERISFARSPKGAPRQGTVL